MRRRRQVFLISGAIFGVLAAYLLWPATSFSPGLTEENAYRLRPGMSVIETEKILGPPLERRVSADGTVILDWRNGTDHLYARFLPADKILESAMYSSEETGRPIRVVPREHYLGRLRHQLNLP